MHTMSGESGELNLGSDIHQLVLSFLKPRWDAGHRDIKGWDLAVIPLLDKYHPYEAAQPRSYTTPIWPVVLWLFGNWIPLAIASIFGHSDLWPVYYLGWIIFTGAIYLGAKNNAEIKNRSFERWQEVDIRRNELGDRFRTAAQRILEISIKNEKAQKAQKAATHSYEESKRGPDVVLDCSPRQAEYLAALWMRHLGEIDAHVSQPTRDGGIDVESKNFVAEVKHHAKPVGPGPIRSIYGVATAAGKLGVVFSRNGYTTSAVEFANRAGVVLFEYNSDAGTLRGITAVSQRARENGLQSVFKSS